MNVVDKKVAMNYLMGNEKIFKLLKSSFINSNIDYETKYIDFNSNKNINDVYSYIHSIKGITLNLGAVLLYDSSCLVLEELKKELWNQSLIDQFFKALKQTIIELQAL
jgi:hypothetical protein